MRDTNLLQLALGLTPPWTVTRSDFDPEAQRLDIEIDFAPGNRFPCPHCGAADCPAYDTQRMSWRHLNFFQHQAYLNARVPRVRCDTCGIKQVHVPWARPDSGFTLLFEALLMTMLSAMPVRTVAKMVGEHDTRLWRVLHHYVDQARARADASAVTRVAIDETAARRGHDYITLFVDIDQARVLFATEGKDAATVAAFADDLAAHGGDAEAIDEVCIDMSPAFIKGTAEHLPNAAVTFDKFHAVKIVNDAVDQVRRAEQKGQSVLRGTRCIWLRNPANLSDRQQATLESPSNAPSQDRACLPDPAGVPGPLRPAFGRSGRKLSEEVVLLGHSQPVGADDRCRSHRQASSRRHPALVRQQNRQWPDRGHQQPGAGRQGKGTWLPLNAKPQGHRLSTGQQTRPEPASLTTFQPIPNSEEPVFE
jgi:transposase